MPLKVVIKRFEGAPYNRLDRRVETLTVTNHRISYTNKSEDPSFGFDDVKWSYESNAKRFNFIYDKFANALMNALETIDQSGDGDCVCIYVYYDAKHSHKFVYYEYPSEEMMHAYSHLTKLIPLNEDCPLFMDF